MAELEIHHETEKGHDPAGQRIGILAAVMAVALAVTTIASHRAHTSAVVLKSEANDQWAFYQSKRLKFHNLELGIDLMAALGAKEPVAKDIAQKYLAEKEREKREAEAIRETAKDREREAVLVERRALRYDFGEGLLEIALVLTSLYFIARKMLLPVIGMLTGILGAAVAATGVLL